MSNITKTELVQGKPLYLKYTFENGDVHILPRAIYELISFRDVFKKEVEPCLEAEKVKAEPNANILNLADNIDLCMNPQLDNLLNQCIAWQNAATELYELLQKVEQSRNLALCQERDKIISYDVINKTLFPHD